MAEPYIVRCEPKHAEWIHGLLLNYRDEMTFPVETLSTAEFQERVFDVSSYYSYIEDGNAKAMVWLGPVEPYARAAEFGVVALFKGSGQKATKLLIEHAFNTLGLHRLFCIVNVTNTRCLRSIEQFGLLKPEGRMRGSRFLNGKFVDQLTFSILDTDPRG